MDFLEMMGGQWEKPVAPPADRFFFKLKSGWALDRGQKYSPEDHDEWQKVLSAAEERDENDLLEVMYLLRSCGSKIERGRLYWGCLEGKPKEDLRKFLVGCHYDFMQEHFKGGFEDGTGDAELDPRFY